MAGVMTAAALVVAAAVSTAQPATGAHWPAFGGDPGRSGFQPVDQGGVPARLEWKRIGVADQDVRTSVLTSAGALADQRVIYGTDDGRVHLRKLLGGGLVNTRLGAIDVSASAEPFGSGAASVSPVETSTPSGLGQVFAVHNELYEGGVVGLQLAQIDEASGERARDDINIPDALGYVIESSPILTPADGSDTRHLFFVARQVSGGSNERLWKLTIANASSRAGSVVATATSSDLNAYTLASPTLVWLNDAAGTPTMYVAVATTSGLVTLRASDLAAGPAAPALGQNVRTPSTPVTASGNAPGAPGSGLSVTPAIYTASAVSGSGNTRVHKLTQDGNSQILTVTTSGELAGVGASALITDQVASSGAAAAGHVYIGTSTALHALSTTDLAVTATFQGSFRNTVPAATGSIVAAVRDDGRQFLLDAPALTQVESELFSEDPDNAGSQKAFGQPSISRRFLQFTSDKGIFVYSLRRATPPTGYWLVAADGGIFSYGDAGFYGSTGAMTLNKPIVGMAVTPTKEGYWLVASDGGIFAFGDAEFHGSTGAMTLNKPIVGMAPHPSGHGYWLVASDGGVFTFGDDAQFHGSTGAIVLNRPIVGMVPTLSGRGYWLVASDGGIFAFGDAQFLGSTGGMTLNKPIVGMAAEPNGRGYWLVASDGGVFAFGRAGFFGSTGDIKLNSPIATIAPSATSRGYLFTAADGGVFAFGDVPFLGAASSLGKLNSPVVGMAAKP
jgi:hypothetical protein